MEVTSHIDALRRQGELLAAATDTADPGAAVPTCPDWTVRDLVRHMGGIHRWATGFVADRRTEPWRVGLDEVVGTWPDDPDLADWLRTGCTVLADALAAAPDDLECWTFLPAPSARAMWARRQAHETAIHRVDAELAVGAAPAPFGPAFAADGVDELLVGFVPRRSKSLRAERPVSLSVHCTDVPAAWLLAMRPDGVTTATETDGPRPPPRGTRTRRARTARSRARQLISILCCGTAPRPSMWPWTATKRSSISSSTRSTCAEAPAEAAPRPPAASPVQGDASRRRPNSQ